MLRPSLFALILTASAPGTAPAAAQGTLSSRIDQAPDGVVRMQYPARDGACGDGRDVVGFRRALFGSSFESYGGWSNVRCVPGPVRVSLTIADRRPAGVRVQIGGQWPAAAGGVTDLGTVSSRDAAAYFLSRVPTLETTGRKGRILLPAVLAADVVIVPDLLALARDGARTDETRRQALQWVGQLGDASVVPALVELARGGAAPGEVGPSESQGDAAIDKRGKKGLASAALAALATLEDGVGVPSLIDLARTGDVAVRHSAVFWLGQSGDPRALRTLHGIIEDSRENERVRANAIFALAHGDGASPAEFAYLRGVFPRLESTRLKESVLQGAAQDDAGGGRWLIERARDAHESTQVRRSALFWAGQREATPTSDLVAAYRELDDANLREHAIFVLSQRDDDAATEALLRIAREDGDRRMRGKALFWLAQKHDDRVTKLISDLLVK
jgi:HEAT repeat protein